VECCEETAVWGRAVSGQLNSGQRSAFSLGSGML